MMRITLLKNFPSLSLSLVNLTLTVDLFTNSSILVYQFYFFHSTFLPTLSDLLLLEQTFALVTSRDPKNNQCPLFLSLAVEAFTSVL